MAAAASFALSVPAHPLQLVEHFTVSQQLLQAALPAAACGSTGAAACLAAAAPVSVCGRDW